MTTDIASLGLDIDTRRMKGATKDIDAFQKKMGDIEAAATRAEKKFGELGKAAVGLGLGLAAAFSVQKVIEYGDAWQRASNQLRLAVDGAQQLKAAQEGVFLISQKTFSSIEATAQLTSKINQYTGDLTGGLEGTLQLVETINKAAAIGGTAAASQAAGLFQLNQALASGTLRGEELNSVMEQTPIIARAIADGLGLTIGQMRKVAAEGKITSELVVKAMQDQADEIAAAFENIEPTVAMSLTKLQGSMTRLVGEAGAPVFSALAEGLSELADALASTGAMETATAVVQGLMDVLGTLASVLPAVAAGFGTLMVVKQLAPVFVALELAMAGSAGRALVMDRAMQLATAGMGSARAAATGLVTALGGPLAVALGTAAAALALFAGETAKARQKFDDLMTAAEGSAGRAVSSIRQHISELNDANPAIQKSAFDAIQSEMRALESNMATAERTMLALIQKRDEMLSSIANMPDTAHGRSSVAILQDQLAGVTKDLAQATLATAKWKEAHTGALTELLTPKGDPEAAKKAIDPYGLLTDTGGKEAERQLKRFVDTYVDAIKQLTDAQRDRAAMQQSAADAVGFADAALEANATVQAFDRQLDILSETEALLTGPMAEAYKFLGSAGKAAARADAERLDYARRIVDATRAQLKIQTDLSRLPRLAGALAVSAEEYELTQLTFELLDDGVALTEEGARAEAKKLAAIRKTTDELDKQFQRARDLAEAPARNWLDGLTRLSDDFWTNWVEKGFGAFDDLGDGLKSLWKQLQADMLRSLFEPIRQQFASAMGFSIGGSGPQIVIQGGGFNAGGGQGGNPGGLAGAALGAANASGGQGGGFGFGGFSAGGLGALATSMVASQGQFGLQSLGFLVGKDMLKDIAGMVGPELAGVFGDIFNPATAMGGMVGSGLASLLGLNGKNAGVGGTVGGLAGAFFGGPIGSAIGSFIGQAIGSLIGPQESDHGAVGALDSSGRIIGMTGGKRTAETEGAVRSAADAISEGQALIEKLGATLGATVDQLVLGTRDPSRFSLTGSAALISSGTTGDPQALVNAALKAVLDSANFASPILQQVADAMGLAGRSFEDTLQVLGNLADVLPETDEQLSQWGRALKNLNDTFEDLRETTQGVASAALDAAEAQAKASLRDDFNEAISDALGQARNPLKEQFGDLLDSQMERIRDATSLGANLADVLALNAEELADFIEQAATNADVFSDLNAQFAALRAEAAGLGSDVAKLDEAFAKAREQIVSSFDKSIGAELDRLSNPTLAALKQMLDAQKARLDQAKALGANISAVDRLNALETQRFFEGLSDDQFKALGNYLGIVEDFTGRIGSTLVQLRDELGDRLDQFEEQRATLQKQADTWRGGGEALLDLRQELLDRYSDLSPQASLDQLRSRFGTLTADARNGNESAIAALPSVAQQLIERSRDLFGSTRDFRNDLDGVNAILDEIGQMGVGRAGELDSQIDMLEDQRDLLTEIRDLLSQADPQEDVLAEALAQIGAGNEAVEDLLRQYLELSALASGQRVSGGQIAGAAVSAAAAAAFNSAPTAPVAGAYAPMPVSGTTVERSTTTPTPPSASATETADTVTAQAVAELISVTKQIAVKSSRDIADLRSEFRRVVSVIQVA